MDLRSDEASEFTLPQRQTLNQLLAENDSVFALHGPATPFAEHRIDTGNHAPISVPPYQMTPRKRELLQQEVRVTLRTDASAYAIGAALLQGEKTDERPVEYASSLLTVPERNTSRCQSTGYSPAYLTFGRELRTPTSATHDLRAITTQETFVQEVTPRLLRMATTLEKAQETHEREQTRRKNQADSHRRPAPDLSPGDYVYVASHTLSSAAHQRSSKLLPRRDGPYLILRQRGPSSYQIARPDQPNEPLGVYHVSALTPYRPPEDTMDPPMPLPAPTIPLRKRGRPRKTPLPTLPEPSTRTIPRL